MRSSIYFITLGWLRDELAESAVILSERSGVEGSRGISHAFRSGIKSLVSPRKLSGLRCSLDSARNDK